MKSDHQERRRAPGAAARAVLLYGRAAAESAARMGHGSACPAARSAPAARPGAWAAAGGGALSLLFRKLEVSKMIFYGAYPYCFLYIVSIIV